HPFLADTAGATTTAITHHDVQYAPPAVPGGKPFAILLRAMLEKDPLRRPAMADAADRLENVAAIGSRRNRKPLWIAGGCAAAAAAVFLWSRAEPPAPLQLASPVAITKYAGIEQQPAFSPDGKRFAFVWSGPDGSQDDVYIRSTSGADETPRRLTNDRNEEFTPVWSPDGKSLAWRRRALSGGDGELWMTSVSGLDAG